MPKKIILSSNDIDVLSAREWFVRHLEHGNSVECPCCKRPGLVVRRKLHSGIASSLCWLVWRYEERGDWIYVPDESPKWLIKFREWGRLRFWGLSEAKPNVSSAKKTSGMWRPTPLGIDFAHGLVELSRYIFTYDNAVTERSREMIHIEEAMDARFNYQELLNEGRGPDN